MRKLAPIALILGIACTTATPPPDPASMQPAGPYGMTVAEEAQILALEDRRAYEQATVARFATHPNALHRQRIALALGRIGPHTFVDVDKDGVFNPGRDRRAGMEELLALANDADRGVRETAAFALGEIADIEAADTLFAMTADTDAAVGGEAVEALSKIAAADRAFANQRLARYLWMTDPRWPEGLRARATRYLFRFDTDEASEAAKQALSASSVPVRQEAAYTLSRRPYPSARPQLELLLTDPNVLTRAYAAAALGRIGEAASAPHLITALGDIHPWVRTNAAVALTRVFEKDASGVRSEDLPRIYAALEDPDPGVRASMIDVLGYYAVPYEAVRQRLIGLMDSGTRWERDLAGIAFFRHMREHAIASFGPQKYEHPELGVQLDRVYNDYRARFVPKLSDWGRARVIEVTDPRWPTQYRGNLNYRNPVVRSAAFSAIDPTYIDIDVSLIAAAIDDEDVIVRANAIQKYAEVTTDPADVWIARLREAEQRERTSEMNDARLAAITALAQYDHPERESFLRSLLTDNDPVVRRVAADLIVEKLGAKRPQITPYPARFTQEQYEEIVRWSREPHTATIHMPRGKIELALLTQDAPMTTWNFAQLAKAKYFDNTSFMRVVPNFVIQGGDPRNDMNGGPGYAIRDEINLQKYTRGAVGMALSGPDTGGSQFFITHSPQPHLDGGYTIFARVYEGMSGVVDQTERGDKVTTITIDEHPPVGAEQIGSISNVSLPLVVGTVAPEKLFDVAPSYAERKQEYSPDMSVVEMMKSYVQAGDRIEVYMGTWCDDSQREVPKFLRIADDLRSQFGVDLPVTYVAVDRSKQQPAKLLEGKSLSKVATFIYYRGDRELGRIEERPEGLFEDNLLTIVARQ